MKYGAPKAEMFAVVYLRGRSTVHNLGERSLQVTRGTTERLSWLKTYSMDQSYIGRWIVRLDGLPYDNRNTGCVINIRMLTVLSKKTEFL